MKWYSTYIVALVLLTSTQLRAQTQQDSLEIRKVALAYIESQHTPDPELMLNPRIDKGSGSETAGKRLSVSHKSITLAI